MREGLWSDRKVDQGPFSLVLFLRVDFGDHLGSRLFPVEPQLRLGLVVRLLVPEEHRLEAVFVYRFADDGASIVRAGLVWATPPMAKGTGL